MCENYTYGKRASLRVCGGVVVAAETGGKTTTRAARRRAENENGKARVHAHRAVAARCLTPRTSRAHYALNHADTYTTQLSYDAHTPSCPSRVNVLEPMA